MYAGFKLSAEEARPFLLSAKDNDPAVRHANQEAVKAVRDQLESFLLDDGALDAEKMQEAWFPQFRRHVFISHSRSDKDLAYKLASWLRQRFAITSFIDSSAWGFVDDLLKQLDNDYCLQKDKTTYSYQKRNISTAHVHTLLTIALAKMIDDCECVFFINSENSIKTKDMLTDGGKTESPWIFSELSLSRLVRRRPRVEHRFQRAFESAAEDHKEPLTLRYPAPQEHLVPLDFVKLRGLEATNMAENALDALYLAHSVSD
jgi:hypothetical protein